MWTVVPAPARRGWGRGPLARFGHFGALICLAMRGRFLLAGDVAGLRAQARQAAAQGADAVFVPTGPLGDPVVLAAGLSSVVPGPLLGVRTEPGSGDRHPALLARDMTSLDLVCGGRSVLCFGPPFDERLAETVSVCRGLWRAGEFVSDGPLFPVRAPANRARPMGERSPLIAFDLTVGDEPPASMVGVADLLLRTDSDDPDPAVCRLEPV
jgi:alkanesulfonate monooxygenase SsuD/methylene tetrahydromethanopterin reductase-like flavin-dependent oxidoreductase (luciferase family)